MASITGAGSFGRARWILAAVLRWMDSADYTTADVGRTPVRPVSKRRWHPPRNPMFEHATMAREMYRL